MMENKKIWIIGAGDMALQYSKVLDDLKLEYDVIGRGEDKAKKFEERTKHSVIRGGIEEYLKKAEKRPDYAIVTVYPTALKDVTIKLLETGIKKILVEKPAGINQEEVSEIETIAKKFGGDVFVAYNRRFLSSVLEAKKIIKLDEGVTSFNFEFTEWGHVIQQYEKPEKELENWFMANSTHVVDLAFYLGGLPQQISSYVYSQLDWYKKASRFAGAGITSQGVLFSYKANWESAGRWSVEMLTKEHKLLLEPMEQLKIQNRGSVVVQDYDIDDSLDRKFKPGLYLQTKSFLYDQTQDLLSIEEHSRISKIYQIMEQNLIATSSDNWNSFRIIG